MNLDRPKKILIIRFSAMGDIIMTSPVVRMIKTQMPNCELHFVTKSQFASLVMENPHIDKVMVLNSSLFGLTARLRREKYDLIIDIHKNLRTTILKLLLFNIKSITFSKLAIAKRLYVWRLKKTLPTKHFVDRLLDCLKKIGIQDDGLGLDFFINQEVLENTTPKVPRKYISFIIGSNYYTRSFPENKWIELIENLSRIPNFDYDIVLLGGKKEAEKGRNIKAKFDWVLDYCGKTNFHESSVFVKLSSLVITNDTGLSHVAASFDKKMISIWGGNIPQFGNAPYRVSECKVMEIDNLFCRPCTTIGRHTCPKKHFKCMNDISVNQIVETARRFLTI